jgi:mannosyltransferase
MPAGSTDQSHERARWELPVLTALLTLGLILRCTRINESLWYDEIASWMVYSAGTPSPWHALSTFSDPINHVGHTLLNWISVNALGSALSMEAAFRTPALLFSLASIALLFGLARSVGGPMLGLWAGLIAATAPVSVLEGVEARGYSMVIALATLSTWIVLTLHRQSSPERTGSSAWLWLAYAACCALNVWTHFVSVYVAFGHGAWMLWRWRRFGERRFALRGFMFLIIAAMLTILLYSPMLASMIESRGMFFSDRGDEPHIFGPEGWHALLQLGGAWWWWSAAPGVVLVGIGACTCIGRCGWVSAAARAVALALLGLPLMVLTVAVSGSWIYARFTFFAWPAAAMLMAIGMQRLWRANRILAIAALLLVMGAWLADLQLRPPKQPLRDVMAWIAAHENRPDEHVLAIGLAHPVLVAYSDDLHLSYTMMHC